MKLYLIILVSFASISRASKVEPYGEMTSKPCVVFDCDSAVIRSNIVKTMGRLAGVVLRPDGVEFEQRAWKPDFEGGSWMAKNCALMDFTIFEVKWMPPKPGPQKVSDGGGDIRPVLSKITITCGVLRRNSKAVVVRVEREWTYNELLHIPYTEIPLGRLDNAEQGSYLSDRVWLRDLASAHEFSAFPTDVEYADEVVAALESVPSG